jgi:CheY-like chemotaxis protein
MEARRVLIVDDDPDIVVYLTSFLEDNGYETRAAVDGADALAAVAAFRPDVVLTDVLLPGRSGLDLLVTLRRDRRTADLPVVVMTGMDQILQDDGHSYLTNHVDIRGPDAVVGKPIDPRGLLEVLDRVCSARPVPAT